MSSPVDANRVLATAHVELWYRQQERLRAGEVIDDADWVAPPRVRPGVVLRSREMRREAGEVPVGRGGFVLGRADHGHGWDTIEVVRGQVSRFVVDDGTVDWADYTGIVNTRSLNKTVEAISEIVRRGARRRGAHNPAARHIGALTKLIAILETPGACSNSDEACR